MSAHWMTRYDPTDGEPIGEVCNCKANTDHAAADRCPCSVMVGHPEPECPHHGIDAGEPENLADRKAREAREATGKVGVRVIDAAAGALVVTVDSEGRASLNSTLPASTVAHLLRKIADSVDPSDTEAPDGVRPGPLRNEVMRALRGAYKQGGDDGDMADAVLALPQLAALVATPGRLAAVAADLRNRLDEATAELLNAPDGIGIVGAHLAGRREAYNYAAQAVWQATFGGAPKGGQ